MTRATKELLFIIEKGGYPVFSEGYAELGYNVNTVTSMRKALALLKKTSPEVICAEFNVDPSFRDRVSNLEPLLARLESRPRNVRLILFVERQHEARLAQIRDRYPLFDVLWFPLDSAMLKDALTRAAD